MLWLAAQAWYRAGWPAAGRVLGQLVGLGLTAGLLAAVQLLPTLEMARRSSRVSGATYEFASGLAMPFWNLLALLLPDLYGAPLGDVFYWAAAPINAYWEFAVYAGVLPLIFFCLAWWAGKRSWYLWFGLGIGGLLLALGPAAAAHRLLYDLVPGFGLFRVPARMGYFYVLAAAVVTGLMFDHWFALSEEARQKRIPPLRRLLVGTLILLPIFIFLSVLWQGAQQEIVSIAQIGGVTSQLVRLLLLAAASLALLIWGGTRPRWQLAALALAILMVDLWGHGYKFVVLEDPAPELGWLMADLVLPQERSTYRVMSRGLAENSGSHFGFYHVDGYDDFRTATSLELSRRAFSDARIARLLGGRFLLHGPDYDKAPIAPNWEVVSQPAGVTIYERSDSQPRAFVVHQVAGALDAADSLQLMSDPALDFTQTAVVQVVAGTDCAVEPAGSTAAQVEISHYSPQRVVLQTTSSATGWLVLTDLYYPGWRTTVSGRPATIQPTNYGLRGICLAAGSHEVIFEFRPPLLTAGLLASGSGFLLLVGAIVSLAAGHYRLRRGTPVVPAGDPRLAGGMAVDQTDG
jgi:hypothetical protein